MGGDRFSAKRSAICACLMLACCAAGAHAADYCIKDTRVAAVDLSAPVSQGFLDRMRAIGIGTIIRYYDHADETLPGKTLRLIALRMSSSLVSSRPPRGPRRVLCVVVLTT